MKDTIIKINQGAILNCLVPKKAGSIKRFIMNLEASIMKRTLSVTELLNHTAVIEKTNGCWLIWEASVTKGVCPVNLDLYDDDVQLIITRHVNNREGLEKIKTQAGKRYDIKSWFYYANFLVTHKWKGSTTEQEYSKQWYCSELVYWANSLGEDVPKATPNHVYEKTKIETIWRGSVSELKSLIAKDLIIC